MIIALKKSFFKETTKDHHTMCKGIAVDRELPQRYARSPKDELIQEIGGREQYNFLIFSFFEKIQEDRKLYELFSHLDIEDLVCQMNKLLDVVLTLTKSRCQDEKLRNSVLLNNYSLLEMGVYTDDFATLQTHFEAALHEAWVEAELFEECKARFEMLRNIIEEDDMGMKMSALANRTAEVRIMAAKSA